MNITNLNGTTTTNEMVLALDLAKKITINYGIRGTSIVGIFVNLFGLLVLRDKRLVEKFYDCLFCRCFSNLVVCLLGSIYHNQPCIECPANYSLVFHYMLIYFPLMRVVFNASIICDILLILNRLVLLFGKRTNVFYNLSKKVNYLSYN